MTEQADTTELTEAERIEVRRRIDVAYAVIPVAALLFAERTELQQCFDDRRSKWLPFYGYLLVLAIATALHFLVLDGGWRFTWAAAVALGALAVIYMKVDRLWKMEQHLYRLNERLRDFEIIWAGVAGARSFDRIGKFSGSTFDSSDPAFFAWWSGVMESIEQNVRSAWP